MELNEYRINRNDRRSVWVKSCIIRARDEAPRYSIVIYQQLLSKHHLRMDEPPRNESFNVAAAYIANSAVLVIYSAAFVNSIFH